MPSAFILSLCVTLILVLASFGLGMAVEGLAPGAPRPAVRTTLPNIVYAVVYAMIEATFVSLVSAGALLAVKALGGGLIALPDDGPMLIGSAIVVLLAFDLAEYSFHRLQHAWRPLWVLHALHHSDHDMNVTTTSRHCWIELFIKALFLYPLVGIVFRVGPHATLIYFVLTYYNFVPHANLRWSLGRFWMVLNSPQYHRIHHSREPRHYNRNFAALLPLYDVLFGTYHRPDAAEYPRTGLTEVTVPPGIVEMLIWPFAGRRTAGSGAARARGQ